MVRVGSAEVFKELDRIGSGGEARRGCSLRERWSTSWMTQDNWVAFPVVRRHSGARLRQYQE